MRLIGKLAHALVPTAMCVAIVAPALPREHFGEVPGEIARALLFISIKQTWGMYAPDPQRAHLVMDLVAHYDDGTEAPLRESDDLQTAWGTTWAWHKRRVDIWRYYANFNPDKRNDNRTWYLRAVCVREARTGRVPKKITMYQVKRRFTQPGAVARGAEDLGAPERRLVTVAYCRTVPTAEMIAEDALANPELQHG